MNFSTTENYDVNICSYTKNCVYRHKANNTNHVYRGSSLGRTKPKPPIFKTVEETEEILGSQMVKVTRYKVDNNGVIQYQTSFERDATAEVEHSVLRQFSKRTKAKVKDKAFAFMYTQLKRGFAKELPPTSTNTAKKVQKKDAREYQAAVNFLTLTFINHVSDKDAVKCLNKFLTTLRKTHKDLNFLWVAEKQDGKRNEFTRATNNIHFHLIIDKFISVSYFNALWVINQYNMGIINPTADQNIKNDTGGLSSIKQAFKSHAYGLIQTYLNPLDIKPVKTIKTAAAYVTKYITKNEGKFACSIWHCSRGVSQLATGTTTTLKAFKDATTKVNSYVKKDGSLVMPNVYEVEDKNGKIVAKTVFHYNMQYFHKNYLSELNAINKYFLRYDRKNPTQPPANFNPQILKSYGIDFTAIAN